MNPLPRTRGCFVCGVANPQGLALEFRTAGDAVETDVVFRPEHVGFRDTIHGGLLATVLDEAMVWACGIRVGVFAYCAELTTRFLQPARPGVPLRVIATLTANKRGRLFEVSGEVRGLDGTVYATASGKYLPIPPPVLEPMLTDFVGDIGAILRRPA
jgi:acyl-coenzyme A thioesterase PaaI-like protein